MTLEIAPVGSFAGRRGEFVDVEPIDGPAHRRRPDRFPQASDLQRIASVLPSARACATWTNGVTSREGSHRTRTDAPTEAAMTRRPVAAVLVAGALFIDCGSSSKPNPRQTGDIAVPNIAAGTNFSFDLGAVDSTAGRYYFTDRNNKSVDVIDINNNTLIAQITGTGANAFAGCHPTADCKGVDNSLSGPDGINIIPGTNFIFAGDVDSVKVIDKTSNSIVKTIPVGMGGPQGHRADEGCFDADDGLYMISSPEATPDPFATFISTATQTVLGQINFTGAGGLEQCVYDHGTKSFLVNNDGTPTNADGEVDVIPASFITSGAAATGAKLPAPNGTNGFKVFPLGNCDPTGMDLGPGNDLAVSCRPGTVGASMNILIMDRTNGNVLATVNGGGSDQITYDSVTNRYYAASSRWNDSGKTISNGGGCTAANPCTPVLNIIDAASRTLVTRLPTGNNAHSVAVSGSAHRAYLPYSSAAAPAGCAASSCATFPNGGITVFATE
jgi:hypothetical protein